MHFEQLIIAVTGVLAALIMSSCTNVKYSFQIEDLGETQQYNQELRTAKKGVK